MRLTGFEPYFFGKKLKYWIRKEYVNNADTIALAISEFVGAHRYSHRDVYKKVSEDQRLNLGDFQELDILMQTMIARLQAGMVGNSEAERFHEETLSLVSQIPGPLQRIFYRWDEKRAKITSQVYVVPRREHPGLKAPPIPETYLGPGYPIAKNIGAAGHAIIRTIINYNRSV